MLKRKVTLKNDHNKEENDNLYFQPKFLIMLQKPSPQGSISEFQSQVTQAHQVRDCHPPWLTHYCSITQSLSLK